MCLFVIADVFVFVLVNVNSFVHLFVINIGLLSVLLFFLIVYMFVIGL